MKYTRPKKRQSDRAEKFDRIETRKHFDLESKTRHNQIRESLSTSAQFNCEGCGWNTYMNDNLERINKMKIKKNSLFYIHDIIIYKEILYTLIPIGFSRTSNFDQILARNRITSPFSKWLNSSLRIRKSEKSWRDAKKWSSFTMFWKYWRRSQYDCIFDF